MAAVDRTNVTDLASRAIQAELEFEPTLAPALAPEPPRIDPEIERQRCLDHALADSIEVVARHRMRLGRRVCSRHDGESVRRIFELLRGLLEAGPDKWEES